MIGFLRGEYIGSEDSVLLIDVAGVGYSVHVSASFLRTLRKGASLELFIHTNLRENALELFGFKSAWDKRAFHLLTSVSGIGPKTAMTMMSNLEAEQILSAIVRGDTITITSLPGVGKKTAERLVLEISDKARKLYAERSSGDGDISVSSTASKKEIPAQGASFQNAPKPDIADLWNSALEALVGLGYREGDAITAIKQTSKTEEKASSLEKLIMNSLQLLSRGASK